MAVEQKADGPRPAFGMDLLGILFANDVANGIQRDHAVRNAQAKQHFGVDIPVLPFGNNFSVKQTLSGAAGKLLPMIASAAIGAGGLFGYQFLRDRQGPPATSGIVANRDEVVEYIVDFEWLESQETEIGHGRP